MAGSIKRKTAWLVAMAVTVAACSGGDDDTVAEVDSTVADDGPDGTTPHEATDGSDLAEIGVDATSIEPFERVALTGVGPAEADLLQLWVRLPDGDVASPLYLDDDGAHFSAIFHPAAPFDGGTVEYYLVRDDERGPLLTLDVGALERAPGTWAAFVDDFRQAVDAQAQAFGSSFDDLQATEFDDVAPSLVPLKIAQGYLDDGSSSDIESFPDYGELTDGDRELLDAIAARIDLSSLLAEPGPIGFRAAPRFGRPIAEVRASGARAPRQSGCYDAGIEIADAADLSAKLTTARNNRIDPNGAERQVLDDIGTVTTVGGFIPGVGWVIAGFGVAFAGIEAYKNGTAGLYPSLLTELTADTNTSDFPEDFETPGVWGPVMVTAKSTGWTADADIGKVVLGAASTVTSAAAPVTSIADDVALNTALYARDNIGNSSIAANAESGGFLEFCPQTWSVDITGEPWSTGEAVLDLFSVDPSSQEYEPKETGLNLPVDDTLRVEVDRDQFAGQYAFQDTTISVKPIRVNGPDEVEVDQPGDEIEIEIDIANALDPELEWRADQGGWRGSAQLTGAGAIVGAPATWVHTHVTPSSDFDPYLLVIESTSTGGLRADGDPPRNHIVEVKLKELIVVPDDGKVLTRRTLQYQAFDRDGDRVDVDWRATGGSIDTNGLYTAGDQEGVFQVTATSKENSELTATVPVEVVEEDCLPGEWRLREQDFLDQINAQFGGQAQLTHQGGQYLITMTEDGGYTGRRQAWNFSVSQAGQTIDVIIDSVETGTWIVDAAGEVVTVDEQTSDATVDLRVGGQSLPGGAIQVGDAAFGGSGTYECDEDVLAVTITQGGVTITSRLDRIG